MQRMLANAGHRLTVAIRCDRYASLDAHMRIVHAHMG
jgi:hypothetical protein